MSRSSGGLVFVTNMTRNRSGATARRGVSLDLYVDGTPVDALGPMMPFIRHMIPFLDKGLRVPLVPGTYEVTVRQESDEGTLAVLQKRVHLGAGTWVRVECVTSDGRRATASNLVHQLQVVGSS